MKSLFTPCLFSALVLMFIVTAASRGAGWIAVPSPHVSGHHEIAEAIVAPAAGDVWAIGYHRDIVGGATEFRTLAQHFDGTKMVTVPTPDRETAPAQDFLWGAAASNQTDIWAVGTSLGNPEQTLVEHWNGSKWSIVDSPNPGRYGNSLQAAAALSPIDAWAVGARNDSFYQSPLSMHWDGKAWNAVAAPSPKGGTGHSYLTGVAAVSHDSVWATGWCGSGGSTPHQGYVLHWNGKSWRIVMTTSPTEAPEAETYAISAMNNRNVWVVGYYLAGAARVGTPLVLHYDGHAWSTSSASPAFGLAGVTATSHGVWTVGNGPGPQPPFASPSSLRWMNHAWVNKPLPRAYDFGQLNAITTAPDGTVWAAGFYSGNSEDFTKILHH